MKTTFIYPDLLLNRPPWTGHFYYGIASLSAVLKEEGHETSLFHIIKPINKSNFIDRIKKESPDLICFSATSLLFPFVEKYVSWLVEDEVEIPTICGGIHPTIAPEETIAVEGIDMICRGEGEDPLAELCRKMTKNEDISDILNLWIKKDGEIIKNPLRPIMEDLDRLPFQDRSIFNYENLYQEIEGKGSFMVSRGCPYNCTYCCNHLIREINENKGKSIRYRSVDNVIAEVQEVIQQYPFINSLIFDDDILFFKKDWAEEFTEKYSSQIGLPFICNARANITDKVRIDLLKKAGCRHIKFGIESGNEYIANEVLNRQMTNQHIKKAYALCKEAGFITESFNIVGIPYETPIAVLDTIKLNAAIDVDKMHVSIFQPFKGTKLAELCKEEGFLTSKDMGFDFYAPSVLKLNTISPFQIWMFRNYFKALVSYYKILQRLPDGLSKISIRLSDRILCSATGARILNLLYIPLNYLYRRKKGLSSRTKTGWRNVEKRLALGTKRPVFTSEK